MDNDLKLYFAVFAKHTGKEWVMRKEKLFAKSTANALNYIANRYQQVRIYTLEEVELREGMFL